MQSQRKEWKAAWGEVRRLYVGALVRAVEWVSEGD